MKRARNLRLVVLALACMAMSLAALAQLNPNPPSSPAKLVFIHHSTGENWLSDDNDHAGHLGLALMADNYFVSDTNYGWGPPDQDVDSGTIGDHTDIGNWWQWFSGPNSATYLAALYPESGQNCAYSRIGQDPGGENEIVMFKSCFPNSNLGGNPSDPIPPIDQNPMVGQSAGDSSYTISNAKGIYIDILNYFETRQDKLFILITAPPLREVDTSPEAAANARALNDWLVNEYLASYPYHNVFVFDFYNVLTSNGGSTDVNDLGASTGNHHRWYASQIQHQEALANDYSSYPSTDDSHPSSAGGQKASGEYPQLLNIAYHCWHGDGDCPQATVCTVSCSATVPSAAQQDEAIAFAATAAPSSLCTGSATYDWDFGDGSAHSSGQNPVHTYTTAGPFIWTMTAAVGGANCSKTGTITIQGSIPGPQVSSVSKGGSPFKLKVAGANFDPAIQVFIGSDTSSWSNVVFKDSTYLLLKGRLLEGQVPQGCRSAHPICEPRRAERDVRLYAVNKESAECCVAKRGPSREILALDLLPRNDQ